MKKYISSIPESELDWNNFIDSYKLYLENSLRFNGISESDIDDLVQECFFAIWKAFKKNMYNRDKGSLRSWINRITRNKRIDFMRRETAKLNKINKLEKEIEINKQGNFKAPSPKSLIEQSNLSKENQNFIADYLNCGLNSKSLSRKYNISIMAAEKRVSRLKSELRRVYRINYVYTMNS